MTEKSVLERLREDLAKVCDQRAEMMNRLGSDDKMEKVMSHAAIQAERVWEAQHLAAAIRAHDLSIYESATPASGATAEASDPRTAEALGAHGAADPDVAGLIELAKKEFEEYFLNNYPKDCIIGKPIWHVPKIFRAATRTLEAALQRQADQLAELHQQLMANAKEMTDYVNRLVLINRELAEVRKDAERLDYLDRITKEGACPGLINDDSGRWAVSHFGMQNVPDGDSAADISTSFFVSAGEWKNSVREAIDADIDAALSERKP